MISDKKKNVSINKVFLYCKRLTSFLNNLKINTDPIVMMDVFIRKFPARINNG